MPSGESGAPDSGARQLLTDYIRRSSAVRPVKGDWLAPGPLGSAQLAIDAEYDYYKAMIQRNYGVFESSVGKKNLVTIRHETNVHANDDKGEYDDTAALLWIDDDGRKHVSRYRANADPIGKYLNVEDATRDVNGDGVMELGRLPVGSYYLEHRFDNQKIGTVGNGNIFGMPAGTEAQAEYDVNHDGSFSENYRGIGGDTMFWHGGREGDVASAGCNTMSPDDFERFINDMGVSAIDAYNPVTDPVSLRYTLVDEDPGKGDVPYQSNSANFVSANLNNSGSGIQDWISSAAGALGRIGAMMTGRFASGGDVKGPGSSIGDKIPAYLSDGEFVMNARSTSVNRPFLQALNADPFFLQKMLAQSSERTQGSGPSDGQRGQSGQPATVNISMSSSEDVVARLKVLSQQWELMHG